VGELPHNPLFDERGGSREAPGALEMQIFNRPSTRGKRKNLRKSQTEAEMALWQKLRDKKLMGCKFYRQYGIGEYIADFYCPQHKLVIEIDGSQHYSDDGKQYDESREEYMSSLSIKTIRFTNLDVLRNIEGVLSEIEKELELLLTPSLPKRG
jgi:very-short-patch-repair endonuclease